jgi:hypothetical protein
MCSKRSITASWLHKHRARPVIFDIPKLLTPSMFCFSDQGTWSYVESSTSARTNYGKK